MLSVIWWPMVSTGLRLVMGSWKIMATFSPRIFFISRLLSLRMSTPSSSMLPPTVLPGGDCTRRMIESAICDLPQPDSPTMPSVSPLLSVKETSSRAYTVPSSVKK